MYLLLELSEDFFANMQGMLLAALLDIESDIHYFSKKNRVSSSELLHKSAVHVYSEFCALN